MNFFNWIRDGVREAVLLGVSDAVGDLGTPNENDAMPRRLLDLIRTPQPALTHDAPAAAEAPRRRKLGRGLDPVAAPKAS